MAAAETKERCLSLHVWLDYCGRLYFPEAIFKAEQPTDRPSFHQVLKICFSLMPVYGFWPNQTDSSRAAGAAPHTMLRRISSRFHRTRKDPCADVHTQEAEPRVRFTVASIIGNNSPFLFHFHPLYLPHLRTTYGAAIALYLGCPHKQGMHSMGVCACMCVPPH